MKRKIMILVLLSTFIVGCSQQKTITQKLASTKIYQVDIKVVNWYGQDSLYFSWNNTYGTRFEKYVTTCLSIPTWYKSGDVLRMKWETFDNIFYLSITIDENKVFTNMNPEYTQGSFKYQFK